nr:CinA family protein [Chthonobacter albigriseus]
MPDDVEAAIQRVLKQACERDLKITTAESCTGGLIASLLTDVEGCSHAFERGFVVYTEDAKHQMLGVPMEMLEKEGAVSRAVAVALAEGALAHSPADISLSVTGFAGPAGPGDEPGLVHFASARRGRPTRHLEAHFGDVGRGAIRIACVRTGLGLLREMLS